MKKQYWMIFLALAALAFATLACDFSVSTASISSAILTPDKASTTETATFSPDQGFYLVVNLSSAPDSTKVKAVWYAVDDAGKATQLVDKEIVGSGSPIIFSATNSNPWPAGKYKVELYLNDKLERTKEFSVQ